MTDPPPPHDDPTPADSASEASAAQRVGPERMAGSDDAAAPTAGDATGGTAASGLSAAPSPQRERPEGMMRQISRAVIRRWSARLGLLWVAIVTLCAVFAPLLANSHPILVNVDGQISSPLVEHLSWMDITLLIAFASGVMLTLGFRRTSGGARFAAFCWIALVTAVASGWPTAFSAYTDWRFTGRYFLIFAIPLAMLSGFLLLRARHATWRFRGITLVIGLVIIAGFVLVPLKPKLIVQLNTYRVMEREAAAQTDAPTGDTAEMEADRTGDARTATEADPDDAPRLQWMVHTLIPFSPGDYLRDMRRDRAEKPPYPPSGTHWLGTNRNGADLASIMIHACRAALFIGFISTSIAVAIGIVIGGLMGYFVGLFDLFGMRLVEIFEAIPQLFLLIAVVAVLDADLYTMMAIIGLVSWTGYARFLRAEFLRLRHQDFVQSARAAALPLPSVLFRHMLPNGLAPILVAASFGVASAVLAESTLSFLGIGAVDQPSWGRLLEQARSSGGTFDWWIATFPGLAIFLTVFAYNMIGEALRDAVDPHTD